MEYLPPTSIRGFGNDNPYLLLKVLIRYWVICKCGNWSSPTGTRVALKDKS